MHRARRKEVEVMKELTCLKMELSLANQDGVSWLQSMAFGAA